MESGLTRLFGRQSLLVDTTAVDFTSTDRTNLGAIKTKTDQLTYTVANMVDANVLDWKGATAPAMTGDAFARLGSPAGASVSADIAAVKADTGNLITRIPAALFANITSLAKWLGLLAGKTPDAPTLAEVNATPAGATFTNVTDSLEAIKDAGSGLDAAGVRAALGMAAADLDDQLDALAGAGASPAEIADAVCDELLAGHTIAGSLAAYINRIGTVTVTTVSPVAQSGRVTLTQGDDYLAADGRQLEWIGGSLNIWPDLTGAVIKFQVGNGLLVCTGSPITPTGIQKVRAEPTAAQTGALPPKIYVYDVQATLPVSLRKITLARGECVVVNSEAS